MADGRQGNVYHVTAESVQFVTQDVRKINIKESYIQDLGGHGPGEVGEAETLSVQADSSIGASHAMKIARNYSADGLNQTPPSGPGWMKMSDKIYMNNKQPLKKGATVYKGKQKIAGEWKDRAVKFIPYDESNFAEIQFNLKLEDHPNIVRIYEADEIQQGFIPYIYIVMELCSRTLRDFIDQTPFDFMQRFSFAKQIISGVAFIHKNQILHRDIKLENILLSSTEEHIRIADFGLSKQLQDGESAATASAQGLGTDGYRAPEMLDENPKASFRSDSFSLGIVLSMLFSNGRHPFGSDPIRWRTNIVDNKGLDLSNIKHFEEPHASKRDQLLDLIMRTLKHDPQDRPTPDEILQDDFFKDIREVPKTGIADRIKMFEDQLKDSLKKIDYKKSLRNLPKELQTLLGRDDLDILLQISECHFYLKNAEIDSSIDDVADCVSTSGSRSASDVRKMGYELQQQGHYVRSMIVYKISHNLHKKEKRLSPDDELKWISHRVTDIQCAIIPLIKGGSRSRDIAKDYGLKFMEEMLKEVREVKNANPDVRVLNELRCLVAITAINIDLGEYERNIEFGEEGVTMMKQQFGENASNYKHYGRLLNNLGIAYENSGQYKKAEHCYVTAIEVQGKGSDFVNEEERQKDIYFTKRNLEKTRRKISKQS